MKISYLVIVIILTLYYLTRQYNDCEDCRLVIGVVLGLTLFLFQTYMELGKKKIKHI
jgi:hypothetical protein